MSDLSTYARSIADAARRAARRLACVPTEAKNDWLRRCAFALRDNTANVLAANALDVAAAPGLGLNAAAIDRLTLNPARLASLGKALDEVIALPDPIGEELDHTVRPNGLDVRRVRVPLGVVFFIYESRPNVTVDAAALCLKSGNAVILRGGKEAFHTNGALVELLRRELAPAGLPEGAIQFVDTTDRAAVGEFLKLSDQISVTIPRGGKSLIERVTAEARMPVIKHYDGVCHVYVDRAADPAMALDILLNSKAQRPGVCNAAETLLVHRDVAATFLPRAGEALHQAGVKLKGCPRTREILPAVDPAGETEFRTEWLDLVLSVRVVDDLAQAIDHIETYGSHHTDTIVTADAAAAERFLSEVDSAAVMVNASTRFNDGGELGLGAEIGISTDKLHARGPCGLREMTSYKYVVHGSGQVRG